MGRVEGKVALITGGAMGLGKAAALLLSREGAKIALTDINEIAGQQTADEIASNSSDVVFQAHDDSDPNRWIEVVNAAMEQFGRLDVLVNKAGIAIAANVETTSLEDWRKTMAVNLYGVFYGTQQAIRVMKENGGGSIINLSSIDDIIGEADLATYCASKGGVRTFTKAAAVHCGEAGYKIRVNSIHPGYIVTPACELAKGARELRRRKRKSAKPPSDRIPRGAKWLCLWCALSGLRRVENRDRFGIRNRWGVYRALRYKSRGIRDALMTVIGYERS